MARYGLWLLAFGLLVGCSESGTKMYSVDGTVTLGKKPMSGGFVSFEDTTTGTAAQGVIEEDGSYTLELPAGSYQVMIEPTEIEVKSKDGMSPPEMKYAQNVPDRYMSVDTTDLSADVGDDSTTFDFILKR
ncbi:MULTISPECIES: carboxypeptidase-like regulatory domain-containing protein [Pirellulaceae]|uniref:carboxypeptidase-like regulatory domain-containing protein n=1 Tax=Pirellulaceae TaxID=2691357 RepID=UPI0011B053A6|nr:MULTISPECIES: carboxypeptidase-like regulatory domain-containing protein [Pirellulaceae]